MFSPCFFLFSIFRCLFYIPIVLHQTQRQVCFQQLCIFPLSCVFQFISLCPSSFASSSSADIQSSSHIYAHTLPLMADLTPLITQVRIHRFLHQRFSITIQPSQIERRCYKPLFSSVLLEDTDKIYQHIEAKSQEHTKIVPKLFL